MAIQIIDNERENTGCWWLILILIIVWTIVIVAMWFALFQHVSERG
jgi:threonine/homoserine/homoserine lactone efflux protein